MIEIRNLVKQFKSGDEIISAVDHCNLEVNRGDFISIIGPSGSGKSTLMTLLGMLDKADEGTYIFDNKDVTTLSDDELSEIRNEKIGFVFQSFYLLPKLNATENVMIPLLYRGIPDHEARTKAIEELKLLGLEERQNHLPSQLSGGQQQRVAIARALVGAPDLILADEPTGALDSRTGQEIMELFRKLNQQGQTIILITHDLSIAKKAQRILRIEDGRLTESKEEPA